MVTIDGYSKELCGGTHVARTGDIGRLKIISEGSVASGIRRIEALTGQAAYQWDKETEQRLAAVAAALGCPPAEAEDRVQKLLQKNKELARDLKKGGAVAADDKGLDEREVTAGGIKLTLVTKVFADMQMDALKALGDKVRASRKNCVCFLAATISEKYSVVAGVTDDLTNQGLHAGNLLKTFLGTIGGQGGGKATFAQGGAPGTADLAGAFMKLPELITTGKK
jgi:alanyl-tRNA synthetase